MVQPLEMTADLMTLVIILLSFFLQHGATQKCLQYNLQYDVLPFDPLNYPKSLGSYIACRYSGPVDMTTMDEVVFKS